MMYIYYETIDHFQNIGLKWSMVSTYKKRLKKAETKVYCHLRWYSCSIQTITDALDH